MAGPNPGAAAGRSRLWHRAVVAPTCRIMYVPTPKVVSTAMLWLLAGAEGDPGARTQASVLGSTPALTIHDPAVHQLPSLAEVSPSMRDEALGSSAWIRLGITRDPYSRLFSAWQHSVLVGSPGALGFVTPELVLDGRGNVDVGASFRTFVSVCSSRWDEVTANQHFMLQTEALAVDRVDYTDLPPLDQLPATLERLHERTPRLDRELVTVNEGLGIDHRRCYDAVTAELVEDLYAPDFALLGRARASWEPQGDPVLIDPMGQRLLRAIHDRNERIDLLRKGMGPRWELVRQRHALRAALRRLLARRRQ